MELVQDAPVQPQSNDRLTFFAALVHSELTRKMSLVPTSDLYGMPLDQQIVVLNGLVNMAQQTIQAIESELKIAQENNSGVHV